MSQGATRRTGVVETYEGVPRRRLAVQVQSGRLLVDLVHEVTIAHHCVTVRGGEHSSDQLTSISKVSREGVFDPKSLGTAHRHVVTLHEEFPLSATNQGGSRHRSRTRPRDMNVTADVAPRHPPLGEVNARENFAHFVIGEGVPVWDYEISPHPVHQAMITQRGL